MNGSFNVAEMRAAGRELGLNPSQAGEGGRAGLPAGRILVIDDNPAIHDDIRKILGGLEPIVPGFLEAKAALFDEPTPEAGIHEFQVDGAVQGQEGLLKVLQALKEHRPYDLAFVDVRMPPGWDGVETIARIWKEQPELLIVLCTAYADYSWEELNRRMGRPERLVILKKPFDNIEVLHLAHALCASKRIETLARERQAELENIFRAAPIGMATAVQRVLTDVNDAFCLMTGFAREELVGQSTRMVYATAEDFARAGGELYAAPARGGRVHDLEVQWRRKDGAIIDVQLRGSFIEPGDQPTWMGVAALDITERKQGVKQRDQILRWQQGISLAQQSLLAPARLEETLKRITDSIVGLFDADFCRIWLIRPGDRCGSGCVHAAAVDGPHACRSRDRCLHLLASSGRYTHTDGQAHCRVPLGVYKIGRVASGEEHKFLTNDVANDPRVHDHQWARELGLVSFAGYQLRIPNGETLGVLGLFSKHPILAAEDALLDGLGSALAQAIQRNSIEEVLAYERDLLKTLMDNFPDVIYFKDCQSRFVHCSRSVAQRLGLTDIETILGKTDADLFAEDHALPTYQDEQTIMATGRPIIGKLEKETFLDGRVTWALTSKMPWRNQEGQIIGTLGISKDVTGLKEAEGRLEEASRQAGMAEVATSVLHNIGNVLNSVNTSISVMKERASQSETEEVSQVAALLEEHRLDLAGFLAGENRADQLIEYLRSLAQHMVSTQSSALKELQELARNVDHIKDVVAMQQGYAKLGGLSEPVRVVDLVEDALGMQTRALLRHDVQVIREYAADVPEISIQKHKLLQILVNLIHNAKYACDDSGRLDKRLTVRVSHENGLVRVAVADNGVGIPAENLTKIFSHGFTTRKNGHGFGLHSAALAAREMGGALLGRSEGAGLGATFTVELPIQPNESKP